MTIRLLLADDQALVRGALASLPDLEAEQGRQRTAHQGLVVGQQQTDRRAHPTATRRV